MYDLFYRFKNIVCLIFRLRRMCCLRKMKQSNCDNFSVSETDPKTLLTWNIQSMFYFTTPLKVKNIINRIDEFDTDVVCLQEVFEDNVKKEIINKLSHKYRYYLIGETGKKYIVGEDSGLLILSKLSINFIKEIEFYDNKWPDYMARKTVVYFKIGNYNFSNAHIHSNNLEIAGRHLKKCLEMSPFERYIMMGDLNHIKADEILNIDNNNTEPTWGDEILDYILPINYKDINFNVSVKKIDLTNTTDHLPIHCKISKI